MTSFYSPDTYPSLNALFTRELIVPRSINPNDTLISPVDSVVTEVDIISQGKCYQIKDMSYDIASLLGENYDSTVLEGGSYANFYLSPRDYHRYHAPCDVTIKSITHIPGKLYPVNTIFLNKIDGLFAQNERIIMETNTAYEKKLFIVLVGALNVGKMDIAFDKTIQTNASAKSVRYTTYENLFLKKGELIGWFEMGSTVLLFSEKDGLVFDLQASQKVSFGEKIGEILEPSK